MADDSAVSSAVEREKPAAENADSSAAELQKKIADAFDIFDHESNKTVDVREVGTIVRSLKCCPTEGELHDILAEVEEEEPTGYIRFEKFEPVMLKTLLERRYKPAPEDQLMKAFEVLDQDSKGYLTTEELTKFMTEEVNAHVTSLDMLDKLEFGLWCTPLWYQNLDFNPEEIAAIEQLYLP